MAGVLIAVLISIGWRMAREEWGQWPLWCGLVPVGLYFLLILAESALPKEADRQIVEDIEEERGGARVMAVKELAGLLPAIVLGTAAVWLFLRGGPAAATMSRWLHWSTYSDAQPIYGLATAAAGFIIAGGIGWAIRIFFTLLFGREAFGTGDIHLMAAAGCVVGWPVVLLGFFVTIFAALAAWVVLLPFKRSRAIPLVPYLALGYLVVVLFYKWLIDWGPVRTTIELVNLLITNNSQGRLWP